MTACHLKSISLSLTLLALLLLTIGISVPFFITSYSIWELNYSLQASGFCQPSALPETKSGEQCLFPFIFGRETKYDCTYQKGGQLWCATSCLSNGAYQKFTNCKRTRASTIEGIDSIQKNGVRNIDLARTIQACLLISIFVLGAVAIMNVIEFYSDSCAGNEKLEITTAVCGLFAPILILIGLAIPTSKIINVSDLGWAFWLIVTSAVIAIASVACYIVGLQGDRVARRIYPFKMTEPIDEDEVRVPRFIQSSTDGRWVNPPQRTRWSTIKNPYPTRWTRVEAPPSLIGGHVVQPRHLTNGTGEFQGGYSYPYRL